MAEAARGKRHPDELGGGEVSAFLAALATEAQVAASMQNQALSALLLLYAVVLQRKIGRVDRPVRAKVPIRMPVVLRADEVRLVLKQTPCP